MRAKSRREAVPNLVPRDPHDYGFLDTPESRLGTEEATVAVTEIQNYLKLLPNVRRSPENSVWSPTIRRQMYSTPIIGGPV